MAWARTGVTGGPIREVAAAFCAVTRTRAAPVILATLGASTPMDPMVMVVVVVSGVSSPVAGCTVGGRAVMTGAAGGRAVVSNATTVVAPRRPVRATPVPFWVKIVSAAGT